MAGYLLTIFENEAEHAAQTPKATAELIERRSRFVDALARDGRLRDRGRCRPSAEGKRVRKVGERLEVLSGPFRDDAGALGAYYFIDVASLDEAAAVAALCPALPLDEVAVRPLLKGRVDADKESRPGKIFAFVVLGNTATEAEWVQVMDRIDVETSGCFDSESFQGGLRLEPPTKSRRVANTRQRHALLDGPFLESKEVIGGLFFLRMTSMEDAVRWASESRFVVHGMLEIRELWRS